MKRVLFKLTMPGVASWNGKWSGSGNNYTIVKRLSNKKINELFQGSETASWGYHWDDGWSACIIATFVPIGTRLEKSDGFCGYGWMVEDIINYNEIRKR